MEIIEITSQKQLDELPLDYNGRICIKFGTPDDRAIIRHRYIYPVEALENSSVEALENSSVVARGNSSVVARGNSSVEAWENSSVVALDNSSVVARGNSSVVALENSSVEARGNSSVEARGNSSVEAHGNSSVVARGNSSVVAHGNSSVVARGNSSVVARGNSSVVAHGNSSVVAWDNSSVVARGNSSVVARGNTRVVAASNAAAIQQSGNALIVHMPRTIAEYLEFYEIENDGETAKLYKAVHKIDGIYRSDYTPRCTYAPGETTEADALDKDPDETCGHGIHMAHLDWCLDYGRNWSDLAIIEVETETDGIIVPRSGNGKVRAERCKMIREVPLEECGVYGKILAKRRSNA